MSLARSPAFVHDSLRISLGGDSRTPCLRIPCGFTWDFLRRPLGASLKISPGLSECTKKIHQNMLRIPLDTFTMLLALGSTQDCFMFPWDPSGCSFRMSSGLLQGIPRIHLGFPGQFIRFSLRFALCSLGFPQGALRNYCTLSSS